uniref:Apolipoprotein D n=1 Tax=Astyanax mexicanus TaxID=7994 RepID=A0A3B1JME6_ASTMX
MLHTLRTRPTLREQTGVMMKAVQVLSLTLLSVLAVSAMTFHSGRCPTPPVQQSFDPTRYMGRWYEIQKIPNAFQLGECAQATYTLKDGVVLVLNEELLADGTVSSIEGTAKAKDPSEPAKLEVSFFEGVPPGNYWVLSTDYDNYTLVYGCTNYLNLFHVEFAWILSRGRSLPKETLVELQDILISNGIKIDTLTSTDQELKRCSAMPQ